MNLAQNLVWPLHRFHPANPRIAVVWFFLNSIIWPFSSYCSGLWVPLGSILLISRFLLHKPNQASIGLLRDLDFLPFCYRQLLFSASLSCFGCGRWQRAREAALEANSGAWRLSRCCLQSQQMCLFPTACRSSWWTPRLEQEGSRSW